jgi:radical SAM superfamily enzyme YgiQ (UPF0313 family)
VRALLIYPRFPKTFWSSEKAIELVGRKVLMPPLGLITVAALLPESWEVKLVDRHVRAVTDDEWQWADVVMLSAMIAQRGDFVEQIREARRRGKPVVVGGPYPTALPKEAEAAGADYLVLDEGELTVPLFVEAIEHAASAATPRHEGAVVFRSGDDKPDVTTSPVPRFDLLDLDVYDTMSVQFSRGCPFVCEFCDIITLYGRRPRTKRPSQVLAELDALYALGWRGNVFMVDDNFIGHKRDAKLLLEGLERWQIDHHCEFRFTTEASIDLANEPELLDLLARCRFDSVFVGIETPDVSSLALTKKFQNTRKPLSDSIERITRAGLRVMAGFIIGFDGEQAGAGQRIVQFVEENAISTAAVTLLQALPNTGLWKRLEVEGRLLEASGEITPSTLMNFVPTRPLEDIVSECVEAVWDLYDPAAYLDRTYRYFQVLGVPRRKPRFGSIGRRELRGLLILCWRQGVRRGTRWKFWHHLFRIVWRRPAHAPYYLAVCGHYEHFLEYRQMIRSRTPAWASPQPEPVGDDVLTPSPV